MEQMEQALDMPQTGIQRTRTLQLLAGLRERLEQEKSVNSSSAAA